MYCSDRGFATSRAESLWLSGASNLRARSFASGGGAAKRIGLNGKPEAFRTEGGTAAKLQIPALVLVSYVLAGSHR